LGSFARPFNSLSRDHNGHPHLQISLQLVCFQLPLSGSRAGTITTWLRHVISDDHFQLPLSGSPLLIATAGSPPTLFQLPLSGSLVDLCRQQLRRFFFQLPLSGSHVVLIKTLNIVDAAGFQLPLSGSLEEKPCTIVVKVFGPRDFQLPLSGSPRRNIAS